MAEIVINGDVYINGEFDDVDNELDLFEDTRISTVSDDDLELLTQWLDLSLSTMGYTDDEIYDEYFARHGELP